MNELIELVQQFMSMIMESQDEFSDEELTELFAIANDVLLFIQEEASQGGGGDIISEPDLPAAEFPSSQVNGFRYDPKTQKMQVQFHGKFPEAAGPQYEYENVPQWMFDIFSRGAVGPTTSGSNGFHRWKKDKMPSYGAAMNHLIKAGGFPYKKVA